MQVSHVGHAHQAAHPHKTQEVKKAESNDKNGDTKAAAPKKSSPPPDTGTKVDTHA